jgi:hypothetical protein
LNNGSQTTSHKRFILNPFLFNRYDGSHGDTMKKVLFIAPAYLGTGETVNALIVADQLSMKKVECTFVVSPYGENLLKGKPFASFTFTDDKRKNIKTIKDMIKKEDFDVVVIADYYLFSLSRELHAFLWINFLEDIGVTTLAFDSMGLGREFPSRNYVVLPNLFPPPTHNIQYTVPSFVEAILFPSPPFSGSENTPDVYCGRLYEEDFSTLSYDRGTLREELGVDEKKLIFHPIPKWSISTLGVSSPGYYPLMADIVSMHLAQMDVDAQIVCINPSHNTLYRPTGRIQVNPFTYLPYGTFMKYLFSSDLMITDNILSATMGKAILNRVPVFYLANTYSMEEVLSRKNTGEETLSLVEKHMEGRSDFPVLPFWVTFKKANGVQDVLETFIQEELFNSSAVYKKMKDILTDSHAQETLRSRQDEYIRKIQTLPTLAEIVLSFM